MELNFPKELMCMENYKGEILMIYKIKDALNGDYPQIRYGNKKFSYINDAKDYIDSWKDNK